MWKAGLCVTWRFDPKHRPCPLNKGGVATQCQGRKSCVHSGSNFHPDFAMVLLSFWPGSLIQSALTWEPVKEWYLLERVSCEIHNLRLTARCLFYSSTLNVCWKSKFVNFVLLYLSQGTRIIRQKAAKELREKIWEIETKGIQQWNHFRIKPPPFLTQKSCSTTLWAEKDCYKA